MCIHVLKWPERCTLHVYVWHHKEKQMFPVSRVKVLKLGMADKCVCVCVSAEDCSMEVLTGQEERRGG